MKKLYHILLIVLLICVTGTVLFLILSPDRVPMHFNAAGEPDRIGSKYENVMWPLLAGASVLLFLLLARREMESGVSELAAYQHFAKRCRLQKYVKLVSLLEQNTKLGASGFMGSLRVECREALQERRTTARRLGEEAGTKLLLPMIMMLAIVMVVIIVPAFAGM